MSKMVFSFLKQTYYFQMRSLGLWIFSSFDSTKLNIFQINDDFFLIFSKCEFPVCKLRVTWNYVYTWYIHVWRLAAPLNMTGLSVVPLATDGEEFSGECIELGWSQLAGTAWIRKTTFHKSSGYFFQNNNFITTDRKSMGLWTLLNCWVSRRLEY